ncbi:hypothetical protein ACWGE0_09850 [Lentzea sp. NPDC054927]
MTQPITPAHGLIVVATFGFTGWLITQGQEPWSAALLTLATLAGTVVVTKVSWQGALAVLRRITSNS